MLITGLVLKAESSANLSWISWVYIVTSIVFAIRIVTLFIEPATSLSTDRLGATPILIAHNILFFLQTNIYIFLVAYKHSSRLQDYLKQKDKIVGFLAHDLRSPIAQVKFVADSMDEELKEIPEVRDYTSMLHRISEKVHSSDGQHCPVGSFDLWWTHPYRYDQSQKAGSRGHRLHQ